MKNKYTVVGNVVVVDPCAGEFTTLAACQKIERRFLGCDISPKYGQAAWK